MNYAAHSHCPNCFQPGPLAVCPHCGFDREGYLEEALHLPLFSTVGGEYILGRVLTTDELGFVYIAKKTGADMLFMVKEYYPEALATRARTGNVSPKSGAVRPQGFADGYQSFADEARLLKACQQPPALAGIVHLVEFIEQHGTAYWVMDYVEGCPLQEAWQFRQKLSPSYIKLWLKPLLDTLEQLQQRGIQHGGLNLANIFLRGGARKPNDPVLLDLGWARQSILEPSETDDVWYTLGEVLYQCVNGGPPPTLELRRSGALLSFADSQLDPCLKAAIEICLSHASQGRPDNATTLKALLAPFLAVRTPLPAVAEKRLDDLDLWQRTRQADSMEAYQAYLQAYPSSTKKEAAEEAVKRLRLEAELRLRQWQEAPRPLKDDAEETLVKVAAIDAAEEAEVGEENEEEYYEEPTSWLKQGFKIIFAGVLLSAIGAAGWAAYQGYLDIYQKHQGEMEATQLAEMEKTLETAYLPKGSGNTYYQEQCPKQLAFWQKMAEQKHAIAENLLGSCYAFGYGVAQDGRQAAQWYRKAAEQGFALAQANLAEQYDQGKGVAANAKQAAQWYRKAADQGLAVGQANLGMLYIKGKGVEQDDRQAFEWLSKAAEQGNALGQVNLAYLYEAGKGVGQDHQKAIEWFRKAAEQGDLGGQTGLAYGYKKSGDYAQAQTWFRKAAELGHAEAQFALGQLYQLGNGIKQDYLQAADWYRKAAAQNHAQGQYYLGNLYEFGNGVTLDLQQAVVWYQKAAAQGDPDGEARLGYMLANGKGIAPDDQQAVDWYRKAALQGNILGQVSLGYMYDVGRGVSQDYKQAFKWYLKAAQQGLASAQGNLGLQYQFGKGVEQDFEQAAHWYGKAAAQGYAPSQAHLAYLYASGKGVEADLQQAIAWYQKAAAQGDEDAKKGLQALGVQ